MRAAISELVTLSNIGLNFLSSRAASGGLRRSSREKIRPTDSKICSGRLLGAKRLGHEQTHVLEGPPQDQQAGLGPRVPQKPLEVGIGALRLADEAVHVALELGLVDAVPGQELRAQLARPAAGTGRPPSTRPTSRGRAAR